MERARDPSPKAIAAEAAKIRAQWSEDEAQARAMGYFTRRPLAIRSNPRVDYWNERVRRIFSLGVRQIRRRNGQYDDEN